MRMMNSGIRVGVLAAMLCGVCGVGWAQGDGAALEGSAGASVSASRGKRPMTFADLQRVKRLGDPQISPSGKWVMFSVVDVDLEKNSKVNHLWVVPMAGGRERQVTFWKEGEWGGRFSPDGKQ